MLLVLISRIGQHFFLPVHAIFLLFSFWRMVDVREHLKKNTCCFVSVDFCGNTVTKATCHYHQEKINALRNCCYTSCEYCNSLYHLTNNTFKYSYCYKMCYKFIFKSLIEYYFLFFYIHCESKT